MTVELEWYTIICCVSYSMTLYICMVLNYQYCHCIQNNSTDTVPICSLFPGVAGSAIDTGNERHTRSNCRQHQGNQSRNNAKESTDDTLLCWSYWGIHWNDVEMSNRVKTNGWYNIKSIRIILCIASIYAYAFATHLSQWFLLSLTTYSGCTLSCGLWVAIVMIIAVLPLQKWPGLQPSHYKRFQYC